MPYIPIITKICDECVMGKQHKEMHQKKAWRSYQNKMNWYTQTFVVHFDICHWQGQNTSSHLHMIIREKFGHSSYH
jgi:lipid II:glycine glycyltransferase (peptidoglycan interpeptide bridge formation enzyme)